MAADYLIGAPALALVGGTGLALFVTAAGLQLYRWSLRRQARAERASLKLDPFALRAGRVALAGTVENLDGNGDRPPVEVLDLGPRQVVARPFLLRLANGVRVRVEPGERPLLRETLESVRPIAQLVPGEQVFVRGSLRAPLAAGLHAERAVIGPPRWGRLVLSTEAFNGALEERAQGLGFQLGMLVLTLVISQGLYVKLYLDAVLYWLGDPERPQIFAMAFFWVWLVAMSVIVGSVASAWQERPWHARSS